MYSILGLETAVDNSSAATRSGWVPFGKSEVAGEGVNASARRASCKQTRHEKESVSPLLEDYVAISNHSRKGDEYRQRRRRFQKIFQASRDHVHNDPQSY